MFTCWGEYAACVCAGIAPVCLYERAMSRERKSKFTTSKAGRSSDEMRSTVSSEGDGSHLSPLESDNCMHISISKFYTHELSLTARKQTRISTAQTARGRKRGAKKWSHTTQMQIRRSQVHVACAARRGCKRPSTKNWAHAPPAFLLLSACCVWQLLTLSLRKYVVSCQPTHSQRLPL